MLGSQSGIDSAVLAADRALPFSFAHFFGAAAEHAPAVLETYRRRFRAAGHASPPQAHVALQVTCADTEEEARRLARSLEIGRLQAARQQGTGILPPDEALEIQLNPQEEAFIEQFRRAHVVGDPKQVRDQIEAIARACGVREVGIVTICHEFAARVHSYALVAEAFGLEARPAPGEALRRALIRVIRRPAARR